MIEQNHLKEYQDFLRTHPQHVGLANDIAIERDAPYFITIRIDAQQMEKIILKDAPKCLEYVLKNGLGRIHEHTEDFWFYFRPLRRHPLSTRLFRVIVDMKISPTWEWVHNLSLVSRQRIFAKKIEDLIDCMTPEYVSQNFYLLSVLAEFIMRSKHAVYMVKECLSYPTDILDRFIREGLAGHPNPPEELRRLVKEATGNYKVVKDIVVNVASLPRQVIESLYTYTELLQDEHLQREVGWR